VGRTIADLDAADNIEAHHVQEAVNYRSLVRKLWNQSEGSPGKSTPPARPRGEHFPLDRTLQRGHDKT
jgi:hypothetical protein